MQCSPLCCFDESDRLNAAFFFFVASITLTLFEKPKQQNQEKCRGEYFRRDNRDQLVSPGFQTGSISTLTGAEWPCARSVLAIITSVSSEDKLAKSKRNTRKHRRQSTRKKTSHDGYVPRHARCRITTRLTQNNSVTVMQTMRRNPLMQNRTILIQCDRALNQHKPR